MLLKEWLAIQQHQHKLAACEKGRTLGPVPGPHNQSMQHYVPSLRDRWRRSTPRQSLTPQSCRQHLYPGSPRLRTLHSPRQLILISHSFACVIPASKSSVLASYFELALAVLQFSFLCLLADKRSTRLSSSEQKAVAEERDGQYSAIGHPSPSQLLEQDLVALAKLEITQSQQTRKGN